MSTLHLVEPSCGVKKEKKTLPQAVQSINTGPGLQTKHTLIIVGQGPMRTSEYMFTITAKKQKTSAPYVPVISFTLLLQQPTSWLVSLSSLFRFSLVCVFGVILTGSVPMLCVLSSCLFLNAKNTSN